MRPDGGRNSVKLYRFFTQRFEGGFGDLREGNFANDDEALRAAERMLEDVHAVDVWDEIRRIALIRRQEAA
jgi:hypothetical protein